MSAPTLFRRVSIAAEGGSYCFIVALAWQFSSAGPSRPASLESFLVAGSLPATASLSLILIAIVFPKIFEVGRFGFPLNFTIPLMWCSACLAASSLFSTGTSAILHVSSAAMPAIFWTSLPQVGIVLAVQIFTLSLRTLFEPKGGIIEGEELETSSIEPTNS